MDELTNRFTMKLTPAQRAELEEAARLLGYATLSEWARVALLAEAREIVRDVRQQQKAE